MTDIAEAAKVLVVLAEKPREQFALPDNGILKELESRGYAMMQVQSDLPEQNIWMITSAGLRWLKFHGLLGNQIECP